MRGFRLVLIAIVLAGFTLPGNLDAQVGRIVRGAKKAAENEVDKAVQKKVGNAVACTLDDTACVEKAKQDGEPVVIVDDDGEVITDENGNPVTDPELAKATLEEPGTGRWANYDYLRGMIAMFNTWWNVEDPDNPPARIPNPEVRIGRIPPNILHKTGNMQMIELDGRAVLEMRSQGVFHVVLDEPLPDDFSLEWTMKSPGNVNVQVFFEAKVEGERKFGEDLLRHFLEVSRKASISYRYNAGEELSSTTGQPVNLEFTTVKFQLGKDGYAVMYINGDRVAQIPNFKRTAGSNVIEFFAQASVRNPVYIADIRVDKGIDDPVSVFAAEGAYTTRSIFFDFNSADLRPESTPELERVRKMVEEYGQPVVIEGHTDAIGSDDYNMELSGERAEAVKAYLVKKGVDEDLIETAGKGETDPIGDNETDDGRQENRRVVIKGATS